MTFITRSTFAAATALILGFAGTQAQAAPATYVAPFDEVAIGGSASNPGYYFFAGHKATETYSATGLSSVNEAIVSLVPGSFGNYVQTPLTFTFSLNGTDIGTTTFNPGDTVGQPLTFSFTPILEATTEYVLQMLVTTGVAQGDGAVQLDVGFIKLIGDDGQVPLPGSLALLGLGMLGLGLSRIKRTAK